MSFAKAGDDDFARLTRDLRLGFDTDVDVQIVATHHSKSNKLPIVAAERENWNTSVAWYGFNYHSHYSAFRFQKAIPATLLWPISGPFGKKHMSGHEADCPLPDVTNFVKDYWNRRQLEGFACFAGGWHMATTLRYLEAVSKLNAQDVFDVTMDKTNYRKVDNIDGNAIDFKTLSKVVGIPVLDTYDKNVVVPPNRIVKSILVDWYGVQTDIRPCCVEVEAMPDMLLPAPTGVGEMYVDPRDTRLAEVLDDTHQLRWTEESQYKDPRMLNFVPVSVFRYFHREGDAYRKRHDAIEATPWRACGIYNQAALDTRRVRFSVPNPLDAVLFVKWWLEAGIPCAEQALANKEKAHGQEEAS